MNKLLFALLALFLNNSVFCMDSTKRVTLSREIRIGFLQDEFNLNQYRNRVFCYELENAYFKDKRVLESKKVGNFLCVICGCDDPNIRGMMVFVYINLITNKIEKAIDEIDEFAFFDNNFLFLFSKERQEFSVIDCDGCDLIWRLCGVESSSFVATEGLIIIKYSDSLVVEIFKFKKDSKTNTYKCLSLKVFNRVVSCNVTADEKSLIIRQQEKSFLSSILPEFFDCFEPHKKDFFQCKVIYLQDPVFSCKKVCDMFELEFMNLSNNVYWLVNGNKLLMKYNKSRNIVSLIEKSGIVVNFAGVRSIKVFLPGNCLLLFFDSTIKKVDMSDCSVVNSYENIKRKVIAGNFLIMAGDSSQGGKNFCKIFDLRNNKIVGNYKKVINFNVYKALNKLLIAIYFSGKSSVLRFFDLESNDIEESLTFKISGEKSERERKFIILNKFSEKNKTFRDNLLSRLTKKELCDIRITTCKLEDEKQELCKFQNIASISREKLEERVSLEELNGLEDQSDVLWNEAVANNRFDLLP